MTLRTFQMEKDFQAWTIGTLAAQNWHVHPMHEDVHHPGLPDLSAANLGMEFWLELKCGSRMFSVHDHLKLRHPLTSQQRFWLERRASTNADATRCGVLVSFCIGVIGAEDESEDYVAWVPVGAWKRRVTERLMSWCLSPYTAKLTWLRRRECDMLRMLQGRLTPGWCGHENAQESTRAGVTVRS